MAKLHRRVAQLRDALGLSISYAVKANPNPVVLAELATAVDGFDVSSIGEVRRARACAPQIPLTFVGPAKRREELHEFVSLGAGMVILESLDEARELGEIANELQVASLPVIVRLRPAARHARFGASMSGRHSHFGIDARKINEALPALIALGRLKLVGFHCYSGTNSLDVAAIAASFGDMARLFSEAARVVDVKPEVLIFGAGFGIPYAAEDDPLDLDELALSLAPALAAIADDPVLSRACRMLELGRWIVGPAGRLVTRVIRVNEDGERPTAICDAGMHTNLAAVGLLGGGLKRNWRISNSSNPDGPMRRYHLVGPLCTTLDRLATDIALPEIRKHDMLMIDNAGAYGPTASPTRFISHPEPVEYVMRDGILREAPQNRRDT